CAPEWHAGVEPACAASGRDRRGTRSGAWTWRGTHPYPGVWHVRIGPECLARRGRGRVSVAQRRAPARGLRASHVSVSWNAARPATVLADRETTLREDTPRAFVHALSTRTVPPVDARVYAVLDQAYGRT